MKKAIASVRDEYDFIIIDCPPSLGLLTLNAFTAADSVLIPIQTEFYALEGVSQLVKTITIVQQTSNKDLVIEVCCSPCLMDVLICLSKWQMR